MFFCFHRYIAIGIAKRINKETLKWFYDDKSDGKKTTE